MQVKRWKEPKFGGKFNYQPDSVSVNCPGCGYGGRNTVAPTFQMVEYPEKMTCPKCYAKMQPLEKLEIVEIGN